ncbi:G protein-coupled receptor 137c [Plakobranchus ocellatus]|uniref:G protein-coupled receptor 137c n=1 Tax=Plakobranchus ocellatus TaxID=259542 RepID=A0AAV4C871_9GAST|nr:G protein-coupled receptor 137c [Plakobranchus ocellatus]
MWGLRLRWYHCSLRQVSTLPLDYYSGMIVLKAKAKYEPRQYKVPLRVFLSLSVLAFVALNLVCAWLTCSNITQFDNSFFNLVSIRVILTEALFFFYGCTLSFCIYRMAKTASTHRVLEAKGFTVCQAMVTCIIINLLFLSRAIYNVIIISPSMRKATPNFGYEWINVTDQADALVGDLSQGLSYVSFGIVLFLWEVLPITMVVIFFRVRRLHMGHVLTEFSQQHNGRRVFFFDNPRRYDSEDDLSYHSGSSSYREIGTRSSVNGEATRSLTPHGTPTSGISSGLDASVQEEVSNPQSRLTNGSVRSVAGMTNSRMPGYFSIRKPTYGSMDGDSPKA